METTHRSIRTWMEDDRPREKLQLKGRGALSNAELLAILIGNGTRGQSALDLSRNLLEKANNDLHRLGTFRIEDMKEIRGIGSAKAITLIAAMELGRRRKLSDGNQNKVINSSTVAFEHVRSFLMDLDYEEFWVVFLNRANRVIDEICISKGGMSGTVVDLRMIFREALARRSSGILLAHNHPSGTKRPSEQDISLTKKIKNAAELLDIHVVDHIIVANNAYFSFRDEGLV
ncbi:MAG: DNA repair protein RadC [Flavobacteriales bacterium]|nr:MAG: DNA repair protein RadC [Flavobacteriales bacterium]